MRKVLTHTAPSVFFNYSCKTFVNKVFGGEIPAARLIGSRHGLIETSSAVG